MNKGSEWELLDSAEKSAQVIARPSHTYWQDAWRMLRKNVLAMVGLFTIIVIALSAIFLPMFSKVSYSDQQQGFGNIPPRIALTALGDDTYVYVHNECTNYKARYGYSNSCNNHNNVIYCRILFEG